MHLGIFAKTFPRPTLEETLDAIVAHGLTHVQFNMSCVGLPTLPVRIDEDLCARIAQMFRERGLTMAAVSGTFNLCDPDRSRLRDNLNRLERLAAACRWLDTRIITLCTGTCDPDDLWRWHPDNVVPAIWDELVDTMLEVVEIADRHEVTMAFEPEVNNVVNSVRKARNLLDEVDSPWLKVLIDPASLLRPGELCRTRELVYEAFLWLEEDIVLAHAKRPRIDERLDEPTLRSIQENGMRWMLFEFLGIDREQCPVRDQLEDVLEQRAEKFACSESKAKWVYHCAFDLLCYVELDVIGYTGAVIIHGLEENAVGERLSALRTLMRIDEGTG